MARYFFHIMNGQAILDDIGVELSNIDDVRREAIRASGQMLSNGKHAWKGQAWQMIVADEDGTIIFGVNISIDRHGL
ncbi:hypothetical protein E2F50_22265 [Rhizobium deserti]|uniref:DUF6894 domain-containing protein n=1 Tax=Rhizobium deserti TaxID=2547961 RepID=A0A4R5U7H0_9HYPH|nr:hypothetical protein [Rhizobium deserti]TDK29917.1 hypothetical protein E2F50_22265 [Rhizobium deserti]